MWKKGKDIYVTTAVPKEIGEVCLPPCVPSQQMIFDTSEDMKAVRITVKTMHDCKAATETEQTNAKIVKRQSVFFVRPELKIPEQAEESAAVAETNPESASADDRTVHSETTPYVGVERECY